MTFNILGLNHNTAPLIIRERLAFSNKETLDALNEINAIESVNEVVILSTCNRSELYLNSDEKGLAQVEAWLIKYKDISEETAAHLFIKSGEEAINHISRVACGLDSMILGEPQILGQLKEAFRTAQESGTIKDILNPLFAHVFSVAKKIRTNTEIGKSPVSVAYAAVTLANQFFSGFKQHTALLIGAGMSIELTAKHLKTRGIGRLFIANRDFEKAQKLAKKFNGYAIDLNDIDGILEAADILISATSSQKYLITKLQISKAIKARKRRPIFAVDIAVPRDMEPTIADLEDIYIYTIDDLEKVILEGQANRQEAAIQANNLVLEESSRYMEKQKMLSINSKIIALREYGEKIKQEILEQSRKQLKKGDDIEQVLEKNTSTVINKLMHLPNIKLKKAAKESDTESIQLISRLFDLDDS
ncbi:MAG: glutamyl-tRNA reductase [Woeseiaceae bacterium]|jgi:glutamyl-tRNA reductase|nr:glutamyl-tRNA reductase [Woeseiaceae bacterium]MDG1016854.1 glutamyl-tRNA reductase [Woeseiaceae bacterium]MDG1865609.1 glutamyl-tRNA reductase [Woeseiaceae bacterium]